MTWHRKNGKNIPTAYAILHQVVRLFWLHQWRDSFIDQVHKKNLYLYVCNQHPYKTLIVYGFMDDDRTSQHIHMKIISFCLFLTLNKSIYTAKLHGQCSLK